MRLRPPNGPRTRSGVGPAEQKKPLGRQRDANARSRSDTHTTRLSIRSSGSDEDILQPGHRIGEYRIHSKLGEGGCSTVYLAEHRKRGQRVAIKLLHPDLAKSRIQMQRFAQEAEVVRLLRHPSIVEIHSSGKLVDGRPYLVMEFVDGVSLASLLKERGRLTPAEAVEVLVPVCDALALAHRAGIIHRDIKASNIMIADTPDGRVVKLLDFGIAKLLNSTDHDAVETSLGHLVGTPYTMAPEQIVSRTLDHRVDIYALGVLLYRLLSGRYPYVSDSEQAVIQMHLEAPPPALSTLAPVPPAVNEVVTRAMSKDPTHRYESTSSFITALRHSLDEDSSDETRALSALAIYVRAEVDDGDELDDDRMLDVMDTLDIAEESFRQSDMQIALQTSYAVLGVSFIEDAHARTTAALTDIAFELRDELTRRFGDTPSIHVNISLHVGRALVDENDEIVGGAITDVGSWAPDAKIHGIGATRQAVKHILTAHPHLPRNLCIIAERTSSTADRSK